MFSGLIEERGTVSLRKGTVIAVKTTGPAARKGDSIAVNGVCLTVVRQSVRGRTREFFFDLSQETLDKTTLGRLKTGAGVNLERALSVNQSLGGHIVQGHVDGVGRVKKIVPQGEMRTIWFEGPKEVMDFVVPKGSVAVDGVSLTAAELKGRAFAAALIPYTLENSNIGTLKEGDAVNLEADVIGKYVARYLKKS